MNWQQEAVCLVLVGAVLTIDLDKIKQNTATVVEWCRPWGMVVYGVTKVVQGDPFVARAMLAGGCKGLCDSHWQNLRRMRRAGIRSDLMLIRTPSLSEALETVRYADLSLQTEETTLQALSAAAAERLTSHRVVLMVEAGDLREGKSPEEVVRLAALVEALPGLVLAGIGVNWGCLAGEGPDPASCQIVEDAVRLVEKALNRKLTVVSGGNSSALMWLRKKHGWPAVNHLRIGEAIMLGKDPLSGKVYPELWSDAFVLQAEVIEVGVKSILPPADQVPKYGSDSSMPSGGVRRQALLNVGIQDIGAGSLQPVDAEKYRIIGASSDHLVLEILPNIGTGEVPEGRTAQGAAGLDLAVGDTVRFLPNYEALLGLMTSPYVEKRHIGGAFTDVFRSY